MTLVIPRNLQIKEGFKRYKNVVRDPDTDVIVNYLEGNARWYGLFSGETFYGKAGKLWCLYENLQGEEEKLFLSSIDLSEYELLLLGRDLGVIKPLFDSKLMDTKRKSPTNRKPFHGVTFEASRKGSKKWSTSVRLPDGTYKKLGYFQTEQEGKDAQALYLENLHPQLPPSSSAFEATPREYRA
ncbi:hypothetical protein [Deinococcus sp. Leaf326]|uniref:hypothetical protein n=1 Tax=Deinococcus sp. Leaf326 TaxID=1736338 RepID=UPI0006FEE26E|nr:hypothetical protein [Deinococcus sp. Leaf326]KQR08825.1 hypothetical protein ASF71_09960 [Deinococcus sp. Leaf326]